MAKSSIEPGQLCLGCGANPATSADGTVPLCSSCAAQAKEAKRGVKYQKSEEDEVNLPIG
jgi:predicted amidophosphoribosyltransferase